MAAHLPGHRPGRRPAAAADWTWRDPQFEPPEPWLYFASNLVTLALVVCSAWGFGRLARQRRLTLEQLQQRASALERERDQHARLAAQQERTRIARDMRDVVAHSLSVIVVQADGAAYAVQHAGDGSPASREQPHLVAAAALTTIAETAREALADTRRLVAVLRAGEEADYTPRSGVADIEDLLTPLRLAGREVSLSPLGDVGALPRDIDLAAYRVVQESLTNSIKHAGPGARMFVRIERTADTLRVGVRDDGRGPGFGVTDVEAAGNGLIGMRERVGAYGGTLTAGRAGGGGFAVTASFPLGQEPDTDHRTRFPAGRTP